MSPARWPPPGLERTQGDLWRVAVSGGASAALLVLPILFVVAATDGAATLGPFGDAWWVAIVLTAVGLAFMLDTYVRAARILRRVAQALDRGYDLRTIGLVLADRHKDMGFLVRGARYFSQMEPRERQGVATFRVAAAIGHALAGLWLPLAMAVSLLAAARGGLSSVGILLVTALPAGFAYLVSFAVSAVEERRVQRARKGWFTAPWSLDLVPEEIEAWREGFEGEEPDPRPWRRKRSVVPPFRRLAWLVLGASAVVAVPVLTLLPVSAVGPVLALVSVPRLGDARVRAARAEGWRGYRVEPDPALGPAAAGALYHALLHQGSAGEPLPGERAVATPLEDAWFPDGQGEAALGIAPPLWPDVLFPLVEGGVSAEVRAYLAELAARPGQAEFARLAEAPTMDVAAARFVDPLPESLTVIQLPLPPLGAVREASLARLGAAAHDLLEGRPGAAERKVREVVSVGFLMADAAPTLIENIYGLVIAGQGALALRRLYETEGREADLARLDALEQAAARAAGQLAPVRIDDLGTLLAAVPGIVADTTALRGVRWELFTLTTTVAPCLNLGRMVLGPGDAYGAFLEDARAALVQWPSEEGLFDLASAGFWGVADPSETDLLGSLIGVSMRPGPGSCRNVVRRLRTLRDIV